MPLPLPLLLLPAFWAGIQNALAGGGSFLTFPALLLVGLDPRAANVTSAVALFPGQVATGFAGRRDVRGLPEIEFHTLALLSLAGGLLGAVLLLATPARFFARLVPWLVMFATMVFAWGSFRPRRRSATPLGRRRALVAQFAIAVYGGYFGGGIGILMLAVLTLAGLPVRNAAANKNVLAGVINLAAVVVFLFSHDVHWVEAAIVAAGAIAGGQLGAWLLHRANEKVLRAVIVLIGTALTLALFLRG